MHDLRYDRVMIRYLLGWILILSSLFALPVLLIRAQPYNDSDLHALLTPPEGCPAPCFMGIRPGITASDDAIAMLEAHEWVGRMAPSEFDNQTFIVWDNPPGSILDPQRSGLIRIQNKVVQEISIFTRLKLINVLMTFGQPGWSEAIPIYGIRGARSVNYIIGYQPEWPIFLFTVPSGSWPGKLRAVLNSPITVYYGLEPEIGGMTGPRLVDLMGVK